MTTTHLSIPNATNCSSSLATNSWRLVRFRSFRYPNFPEKHARQHGGAPALENDAVQQLLDIEEIKKLKARYFRYLDTKNWDLWTEIFTEDLQFVFAEQNLVFDRDQLKTEVTPEGQVHDGRDQFISWVKMITKGVTTVHRGYMPEITITGSATATGIWAMTDYLQWPGDGPPIGFRGYGHYNEHYVRTTTGWRIKRSVLSRIRIDPLEGGLPPVYEETTKAS